MITRFMFSLLFISISFGCFSQENDSIFSKPDVSAKFPGGTGELNKFLTRNLNYPSCNIETENYKGLYRLTIEKNGKITTVGIVKSFPEVDESVVKCLESMPDWIPATHNGKPVRSAFLLPVVIHLTE